MKQNELTNYRLSNAKENDSEKNKKINLSNTTLTSKTNVETDDNADKDSYPRHYKNISELTLTVIIIILPVYFQCLSMEINIEAMN